MENINEFTEAKKKKRKRKPKVTYSTGYPAHDINMFNKRFDGMPNGSWEIAANREAEKICQEIGTFASAGVDGSNISSVGSESSGGEGVAMSENINLSEAKRYVRRYYIRPINKFCSTKTDIINYLIEYNDQDCTIYTLNNLVDNDDVSKLTSKDIIYFYEDGMLFDKNHMKLMDYELAVKNEEEREKIDIERASEKELKRVYADRIIGAEFEESISHKNIYESIHELDLDFDDIDIYGKTLRESKKEVCCICGEELDGYGNNPEPYKQSGKCCDACNIKFVIPARLEEFQ